MAVENLPPGPAAVAGVAEESGETVPGVLARKRPTAKPSPSPSPAPAEPAAAAPASSPTPTPTAAPSPTAAAPAGATPAATPSPDPATPAFLQKYEAAYVKYLEKDFAGAKAILNEADLIQKNQPASIDLRNKIFSYYYKIAYAKYTDKDYAASQTALDDADAIERDQPDSLNLRGLIFSRQRVFDQAEVMFKKAVGADPGFWAAKFNMAELPFTYKNYTVARTRYEQLLAETDVAKQPREAELTQFKVFLTLLLEGKESAARAFMARFSFTGATPARYYCQAALDFYGGSTDKAAESIAEARKDFPAQIEAIFADSFYRVGWLTDPSKPAATGTSIAAASPTTSPAVASASPTAAPTLMAAASPSATPLPVATPAATTAPTPNPSPTRAVTATPTPTATAIPTRTLTPSPSPSPTKAPTATPSPTSSPSPTKAATATPSATPSPTKAATATPTPTATAVPTKTPTAVATPSPSPAPTKATITMTPAPSATVTALPAVVPTKAPPLTFTPTPQVATATPLPTPVAASPTPVRTAVPTVTPAAAAPAAAPSGDAEKIEDAEKPGTSGDDLVRLFVFLMVPCYLIGSWIYIWRRVSAYRAEARKPALHYGGRKRSKTDGDAPR